MGETSHGMARRRPEWPASGVVWSWSLIGAPLGLLILCSMSGPAVPVPVRRSRPASGQQKTSWPEAQEVAGERDVAFAVR